MLPSNRHSVNDHRVNHIGKAAGLNALHPEARHPLDRQRAQDSARPIDEEIVEFAVSVHIGLERLDQTAIGDDRVRFQTETVPNFAPFDQIPRPGLP